MDIYKDIEAWARRHFHGTKGSHDWEHTERVLAAAVRIAKKEKAGLKIVRLAAILHDIARAREDASQGKIDHAAEGAEMAALVLKKHGVDDKTAKAVSACIRTHRFRGNTSPKTLEARVLFDADKLDSIGAVGIGRAFLFAGEIGAKLHNKGIDLSKTRLYTPDDTAWREYNVKNKHIKSRMLTKEGLRLARERHSYMKKFFVRMNREVSGEL
jgi:uncharacterized protein